MIEVTCWEQLKALPVGTEIEIYVENTYWGYAQIKWVQDDAIGIGCEVVEGDRLVVHLFPDSFSRRAKISRIINLTTIKHEQPKIYA